MYRFSKHCRGASLVLSGSGLFIALLAPDPDILVAALRQSSNGDDGGHDLEQAKVG